MSNKELSVEEVLAACRRMDGGGGGDGDTAAEAAPAEAAAESPAAAAPAKLDKPASQMSVEEMLAGKDKAEHPFRGF